MAVQIPWYDSVTYSGIVGDEVSSTVQHPILFIHGNSRDETDWTKHFSYFQSQGVRPEALWAIGFDNSTMTHQSLSDQLEHFVQHLFEYTSASTLSIVSHSLGVTVGRVWLERYDRYDSVTSFVGIAGANHGSSLCPPHQLSKVLPDSHRYKPCQAVTRLSMTGTKIDWLNREIGETPGNINYYTIRGTKDKFFCGCSGSPALEGAVENVVFELDHDEVRTDDDSVSLIYDWIVMDEHHL